MTWNVYVSVSNTFSFFFYHLKKDQGLQRSSSLINIRPPSPRSPGLSLSDPSNPILHPPRLSYSSFNKTAEGSSLPQKAQPQKRVEKKTYYLL